MKLGEVLNKSSRRFSREMVHALLNGETVKIHFSTLRRNGETPKELEDKVLAALAYQVKKGKSGEALRDYRAILLETGKDWDATADAQTEVVVVKEV